MNRRNFLHTLGLTGAAALGAPREAASGAPREAHFAQGGKPMVKTFGPGYQATLYDAVVPDTLDLAERAELALHGIARTIDPADDYMMWFGVYWCNRPPFLLHIGCDEECTPKFLDAVTQLRLASGSDQFLDIEQGMVESLRNCVEEGLYVSRYNPQRPWRNAAYPPCPPRPEDYFIPGTTGILMTALIPRHDLGLTPSAELIQALACGLDRVSIGKDDYAYFPLHDGTGHPFSYARSTLFQSTEEARHEQQSAEGTVVAYFGYPIRGLAMWAERTGDEQALELAGKFARFVMQPRFWGHPADPPHVAGCELGHLDSHFHARAIALRGLLEYGLVAGDRPACDFVRSAYEYLRTYGISEIGYIPCWPDRGSNNMEACLLGDLVALTVKMSDAGLGDFWEDADRIIRNHLVEAQLTSPELMAQVLAHSPELPPEQSGDAGGKVYPGQVSQDEVMERALGIFASYLNPTSATRGRTMQCCTANAARGLYYAWESITRCHGDEAQVNLLLNRAAPWLDLDSYLPYQGRVVIRNKTARRISVRIPTYVDRRKLDCAVNGARRKLSVVGGYQVFDPVKPGDVLELRFPLHDQTLTRTANAGKTEAETPYTLTLRANTVLDISPRDESPQNYPFYQRDPLRGHQAPLKTIRRSVMAQVARW